MFSPDPEYSKEARDAHYEGTCVLWLWIGPDGKPHSVRVARGVGHGLDEKAVDAVKKWKFEPAMMNGEPVAVQINVEVSFRLPKLTVSPMAAQVISGAQQQIGGHISGQTFRNEDIGLTWTFPETLAPRPSDQLPHDPNGRERVLLALWDKTQKIPVPLVVFLWDTKTTPETLSPSATAQQYLKSLKPGEGFKLSKPTELELGGRGAWKMDYSRPDDAGQSFNSAIVMPLRDRTLLFIQLSARSERELDTLAKSLAVLKFDPEK